MKRPGSLLARLTGRPAPDDGDSGVLWRAAAAAFGEAVIRLIDDGAALAAGAPVLGACALALGLAEDADPAAILAALER